VSERELQDAVIEIAQMLGWRVAHFRPAKTAQGWRTAVQGDGVGYPDITMTRNGFLIFAELKSQKGKLGPSQQEWLDALTAVSVAEDRVHTFLWRPEHWLNGTIAATLTKVGARRAAA
jgi:hypothetical protein